MFDHLHFGPAGNPISSAGSSRIDGLKKVIELGLDGMEIEFVRGVNYAPEFMKQLGGIAKKHDVALTVHAPYFINLHSDDKAKRAASEERIISSARAGHLAGAYSVTFHAAFCQGKPEAKVRPVVEESLKKVFKVLQEESIDCFLMPETTGKKSQYGSFEELLELSKKFDKVQPCIDFAHLFARDCGKMALYEDSRKMLTQLEEAKGKDALKRMHIHLSGIEYTAAGERRHIPFRRGGTEGEKKDASTSDGLMPVDTTSSSANSGSKKKKKGKNECAVLKEFYPEPVLRALKEFNCTGAVVCESPILEEDALYLKEIFRNLK